MSRKLSEILTIRSEFNFFKAAAHLDPFDLHRLEALVDDLLYYTARVREIFASLASATEVSESLDTEWLAEGRNKFYDISRNIESIDSIVLQALNLLETNLDDSNMPDTTVFDKLDVLSEASLEIKRGHLLPLKTKIDVSVEYNDIYNLTMNSINTELENCLKKCFKIHEKRFSSPVRHAPSFNLDILTKKLLQQRNQLRLPLINEIDSELYEEYLLLKNIVDPLKASLNFIPLRIEDFKNKYGETNLADTKKMEEKYDALVKEMQYLQNEVNDLKYELVDKRWSEIFSYLNTEMSFLISSVEKEVSKIEELEDHSVFKSQVFKRLKYTTDIVENTFILINQAIDEQLIEVRVMEKSNELANAWLTIKEKIPEEYINKIVEEEGTEESRDDSITQSFRKLSLDQGTRKVSGEKTVDDAARDKRKSRYGQFLLQKMNLTTVIFESDPTSVRKPEDLQAYKVLGESAKHNQLGSTPSKSKDPLSLIDLKIPELRTSLSNRSSNSSVRISTSSNVSFQSSSQSVGSPHRLTHAEEPESPISVRKEVHEETLNQLLNGSPDVLRTPVPKRHVSDSTAVLSHSKIPVHKSYIKPRTPENFKSRIPRPLTRMTERPESRLSAQRQDRPPSRASLVPRSNSSLGSRTIQRPSTSLALSRAIKSEIVPSRIGVSDRHSMIPQTPVRTTTRSRRTSMLPQPTPIKELVERSSSRMSMERAPSRLSVERSESRLSNGRHSVLGSRPGSGPASRNGSSFGERMGAPPPKPVWR